MSCEICGDEGRIVALLGGAQTFTILMPATAGKARLEYLRKIGFEFFRATALEITKSNHISKIFAERAHGIIRCKYAIRPCPDCGTYVTQIESHAPLQEERHEPRALAAAQDRCGDP